LQLSEVSVCDVQSLEGIEFCTNLEEVEIISMLKPDFGELERLLLCPNLRRISFNAGDDANVAELCRQLKAKGVKVS
jgi:hypothetical protein